MEVFALAVDAAVGASVGMISEGEQRRHVVVGHEPHIAALAAVASVGPAEHDGTFTPERHATRSTVAPPHVELALVDELGHVDRAYRPCS
jgi:hypothetical protein